MEHCLLILAERASRPELDRAAHCEYGLTLLDELRQAAITKLDLMKLSRLSAKTELHFRALDLDMVVTERYVLYVPESCSCGAPFGVE